MHSYEESKSCLVSIQELLKFMSPHLKITDNRSTATCKESRGHLRNKFKISLVIVTSDGFEDVITFYCSSPRRKSH